MEKYAGRGFTKSALAIPIREIEPWAQPLRRKHTTDGASGMPPHVTVLYPFVSESDWHNGERQILQRTLRDIQPFHFKLESLKRFPSSGVLFLDPVPNTDILAATRQIAAAFSEYPPYGGTIPIEELHPHVTLAVSQNRHALDRLERLLLKDTQGELPVSVTASEIWFVVRSGGRWQLGEAMPLG